MKKVLLSLILLLCAATALAAEPVYSELQSVTCMVNTGRVTGTGVMVTKKSEMGTRTFVWTAAHVVQGLRGPDGRFANPVVMQELRDKGRLVGAMQVEAKVLVYSDPDKGEDLALLEVLQVNFRPMTVTAKFATEAIQPVGTDLIHVGGTLGLYNSVSTGIVSQTDRALVAGKVFDQTSVMGYPGSSGGGVFLRDGRYIGMLTRGSGAGLNFIVPMRRILPWAKQMGVLWALNDAVLPSDEERAMLRLTDGTETAVVDIPGDMQRDAVGRIIRPYSQHIQITGRLTLPVVMTARGAYTLDFRGQQELIAEASRLQGRQVTVVGVLHQRTIVVTDIWAT